MLMIVGPAGALLALAAAAVQWTGRRERDRFIRDIQLVRAEALVDRGRYQSMR